MYSCNKIIRPEFKFPAKFEMAFLKYQPWDANLTKYPKNILDKTAGRILYLLEFLKNFNWRNQIFLIKRASDFSNLESLVEVVSFKNSLKMNSDKISFLLQKPDGSGIVQDFSPVSNIGSDNSQNVGLEDYNNISVGIFPNFTTPSIKITLGQKELENSFKF